MYYNYYVIGDVIQVVPAMVVTYKIIKGASIHGGDKLFTSDGFSYTHRRTNRKNETLQFTRCACVRACARECVHERIAPVFNFESAQILYLTRLQ